MVLYTYMTITDKSPIHTVIKKRAKDDVLVTSKVDLNQSIAAYLINDEKYKFTELQNRLKILDSSMLNVEKESASFVEWIVSKGLDIDGKNSCGSNALDLAIEYNLLHVIPVLLKNAKKIDYVNNKNGNKTLLHSFLEMNTLTRDNQSNRLTKNWYFNYSQRYSKSIIKILFDRGLSPDIPDKCGDTALHVAIEQKETLDVIEMILERSTNVNHKNSKGKTPFDKAIWQWKLSEGENNDYFLKILQALLDKGATDEYDAKPLFHVVEKQMLLVVEYLKENGADFSDVTENGQTLMHSLLKGSSNYKMKEDVELQLFDVLINNGCQVNAKDNSGLTPLHIAASNGNREIVKKLLDLGANVNCRNNRMETPLLYSIIHNNQADMVKFLLEHGAYVNVKNVDGVTALHATTITAARRDTNKNNVKVLKYLLKYGADFNALTNEGHSVLRMGLWHNYNLDEHNKNKVPIENTPKLITTCIHNYCSIEAQVLLMYYVKYNVLMDVTDKDYIDLIKKNKMFKAYNVKCLKVLRELKNTSIDSSATLYRYLRMNLDGWRVYAKNENLQKLIQSANFKTKFPAYSDMVWACYHEGVNRRGLLGLAKKSWLELTEISLPEVCLEIIFSFLNNADLFYFIKT